MGLGLQSDAHMLDGGAEGRVGDSGDGAGEEELGVGELGVGGCGGGVVGFKLATGIVESTKLDRNLDWVGVRIVRGGGREEMGDRVDRLTQAPMPMRGVRVPCSSKLGVDWRLDLGARRVDLVEGEGTFVFEDLGCAVDSAGVLGCCL